MITAFSFDGNIAQTSALRAQEGAALPRETDREGQREGQRKGQRDQLPSLRHGIALANRDRTIVFQGAGNGSFDVPETYELLYEGWKVRLECGGGGLPGMWHALSGETAAKLVVLVAGLHLPPALRDKRDAVLALLAEGFAVGYMNPHPSRLTVEFRMCDWLKDPCLDEQDVLDGETV